MTGPPAFATAGALPLLFAAVLAFAQDEPPAEPAVADDAVAEAAAPSAGDATPADQPETIPLPPEGAVPVETETQLDDIVVTAQKRVQRLHDVPISISAFDGKFMTTFGITDFRDLSLFVPNARVDVNGTVPQIAIRGFNTNWLNRSFEQAVGLVVDGMAYGTSPYFQLPLYDIERVEVLRGPQGTLHGKNATAGVFNVATRPADGDKGNDVLTAQIGDLGQRRVEFGLGGTLIEDMADFRVAGLFDQRDGFIRNTSGETIAGANTEANSRDRRAGRLKVAFPDVAGAQFGLAYDRADAQTIGVGAEQFIVDPKVEPVYRGYDPGFDGEPDNWVGSSDGPEGTTLTGDTVVASLDRDFADWSMGLIAGYSRLRFHSLADVDVSPAPALILDQADTHPQTTAELRVTAPLLEGLFGLERLFGLDLGDSTLTAGLFWQRRDITDGIFRVRIDPEAVGLLTAAQRSPTPLAIPPGSLGPNDPSDDEVSTTFFSQSSRATAGYGQFEWSFIPSTTLLLGLRYSVEDKVAAWDLVTEQGSGELANAALGREEYSARRERQERNVSPKILLRYAFSDDANVYAGWVRSFRAGGFNQLAARDEPEELEYERETVTSWELGSKLSLFDGAARLQLGLYWMTLLDFQVLTQVPQDLTFTVINAGKARARGVELDGHWLASDWLTLQSAIGFNDSEFLDFPFGTCAGDDPDAGDFCDHTGEPLDFAPRLQWSFNPRFDVPLPWGGLALSAGAAVQHQSEHFADFGVRDPRVVQKAATRYNADFGVGAYGGQWTLRVAGENLTDEPISVYKSDVPLALGSYFQLPQPGRLVKLELQWRF